MPMIVLEVQQLVERLAKTGTGSREHVRQVGEAGNAAFERRFVADVENHSRRNGRGGILPVALLRAVLACADYHVRDILGVAHIARREDPHLAQRIESGAGLLLDRRKLEAEMALLAAEAGRFRPVLTLDVVDDSTLFPCQQRWNHQTDAFSAACWRERENVLGAVMTEVTQPVSSLRAPTADVDSVFCGEQPGVTDIVFVGPARGAVEILCVFCQLACAAAGEYEEDANARKTPCEDDHLALEERPANPLILRSAIAPSPRDPRERLVDTTRLRPQNRRAECWLILEFGGDVLRRDEVHDNEQQASERRRAPVVSAKISGFARNSVEFRLFLRHGCASSSTPILRLGALPELADHALGIGVVDAHAFADLRLPIEQFLRMNDASVGGLALDDMKLGFPNDRAAITAALRLRGERLRGIAEHLRGDRLGLCERVAAWRVNGTPPIRCRLLCVHIDRASSRFVAGGVLCGLARRSRTFVCISRRFKNLRIASAQGCVRFLLFDPLPVAVDFLCLPFQDRRRRSTGGPGRENGAASQFLLTDGLVALQRENEIGGGGGVVSRAEYFVLVALERPNPGVDVSRVLFGIMWDSPLRGEEHAGQLRAKLLLRIVHVAEAIGFGERGAVEPGRVTGPMGQLV